MPPNSLRATKSPASTKAHAPGKAVRHILVPVDYSEESKAVVAYAAFIAGEFGADLLLLHVWELEPHVPSAMTVTTADGRKRKVADLIKEEADAGMLKFLEGVSIPQRVKVTHHVTSGLAASAIVKQAKKSKCDLIVMGTQGRTGLSRLLLGSVAEKVLRTSPVPILVVPANK